VSTDRDRAASVCKGGQRGLEYMSQEDSNIKPSAQIRLRDGFSHNKGKLVKTNNIHRSLDGKCRITKWADRKCCTPHSVRFEAE
jgi:hypothetical protein